MDEALYDSYWHKESGCESLSPLVSILVPCHNAEEYVAQAIESALAQTWSNIEIVAVNDGSTDGSAEVLSKFKARNFKLIKPDQPLRSAAKARNLAYQNCSGDFIKYFDADDLLHPQMVERQLQRLEGNKSDVASSGWGRFYGNDLSSFKLNPQSVWRDMDARDWLVEALMDARPMMQPGMFLIPRKTIDQVGGWDEELSLIDDFEFFARVLSHAKNTRFTPDVPLMYRSGLPGSLSGRKSDAAIESAFQSLMRGTGHLLNVREEPKARQACANMLQDFIYTFYPSRLDLRSQVATRINELGGSDLQPDGSPKFHLLRKFVGWKITRYFKRKWRK